MYEPLGFDSIWSVEHHFDDYTMCPDVLQFLTYYAGRTKTDRARLDGGRAAVARSDARRRAGLGDRSQSNGRMMLGFGRGLARIEFDGFRVHMGESRERFIESAEMIIEGLEKGYCEYDGKYHQAAAPRHPAQAVQVVQGPHLRGGGVARVRRASWRSSASAS